MRVCPACQALYLGDDPFCSKDGHATVESDGTSRPDSLVGNQVGNYKVTNLIGEGGMGVVYRAEHPAIGRVVAVKVLHEEYARRSDAVERFFTEAKAVNQIRHENIVDIIDFGLLPDQRPYFVMEYLEGSDLDGYLSKQGRLALTEAVDIMVPVLSALQAAHDEGIIHRDLKPENIFLAERKHGGRTVKLLDFGIAKLLDAKENFYKTRTGSIIGTPAYMSPEQASGSRDIDHRADIYAAGIILYELLVGEPPFSGETALEIVHKQWKEPPVPPRKHRPEIPEDIEQLVLAALEKDRDKRIQTAAQFGTWLKSLMTKIVISAAGGRLSSSSLKTASPHTSVAPPRSSSTEVSVKAPSGEVEVPAPKPATPKPVTPRPVATLTPGAPKTPKPGPLPRPGLTPRQSPQPPPGRPVTPRPVSSSFSVPKIPPLPPPRGTEAKGPETALDDATQASLPQPPGKAGPSADPLKNVVFPAPAGGEAQAEEAAESSDIFNEPTRLSDVSGLGPIPPTPPVEEALGEDEATSVGDLAEIDPSLSPASVPAQPPVPPHVAIVDPEDEDLASMLDAGPTQVAGHVVLSDAERADLTLPLEPASPVQPEGPGAVDFAIDDKKTIMDPVPAPMLPLQPPPDTTAAPPPAERGQRHRTTLSSGSGEVNAVTEDAAPPKWISLVVLAVVALALLGGVGALLFRDGPSAESAAGPAPLPSPLPTSQPESAPMSEPASAPASAPASVPASAPVEQVPPPVEKAPPKKAGSSKKTGSSKRKRDKTGELADPFK